MDLCFASSFLPGLRRDVRIARPACAARAAPTMALRGTGGERFYGKTFSLGVVRDTARAEPRIDDTGNYGGGAGGQGSGGSGGGGGESAGGGDLGPLSAAWAAYINALESQPILTKAVTSLVGFFLGDLIAQKFLGEKGATLDMWRLARMASFGFLIHGPTGHYFYQTLDRVIVGKTAVKVASKVFVDQILWAPIFTVIFFSYLGIVERKSGSDIVRKLKDDTFNGVTASWKFWPVAHVINFRFVPTSQRLLYINTLQVAYNVILSILGNKPTPEPEPVKE